MSRRRKRGLAGLQGVARREFVAVASILKKNNVSCAVVDDFSTYFAKENPRFDKQRFSSAAGCGASRRAAAVAPVRRRRSAPRKQSQRF